MMPMVTGRVGHQCVAGVNTAREHGCQKWRPWSRAVDTVRENG